jgi:hypothetical protein
MTKRSRVSFRPSRKQVVIFIIGILCGAAATWAVLGADYSNVRPSVDIQATQNVTSYLEKKSQFKGWACESQIIGYTDEADYARFICDKPSSSEALCDVGKFGKDDDGSITTFDMPTEGNYSAQVESLLPAKVSKVYSHYQTSYGCQDLSAMLQDRIQPDN